MRSAPQGRLGRFAIAGLHLSFGVVLALHVVWASIRPASGRSDFSSFYLSAVEMRRDGNPYATRFAEPFEHDRRDRGVGGDRELAEPVPFTNLNPPFQTVLMEPLAHLPYRWASWLWYVLGVAGAVWAAFLTSRLFLPPVRIWGPAAALVVMLCFPTLTNVWLNQFGFYFLVAVAGMYWLVEEGRMKTAAAVGGLLAGVKIFAGLLGVYFLVTRRWRALAAFVAAFAASVLVGGIGIGWGAYADYVRELARVDFHSTSWNASVFGVLTRWFGSPLNAGAIRTIPRLGYPLALALAMALGLGYAGLLWLRGADRDPRVTRLGIGLTCTAMILLSPLGWIYYFPALLPVAAALYASADPGRERSGAAVVILGFICLSNVPQSIHAPHELGMAGYDAWKSELPVLALVLLSAAHVRMLLRGNAGRRSVADPSVGAGREPAAVSVASSSEK